MKIVEKLFRSRVLLRSKFSWLGISKQNLRSSSEAGVGSICGSLTADFGKLDKPIILEMGNISDSAENWTPLKAAEIPLFRSKQRGKEQQ